MNKLLKTNLTLNEQIVMRIFISYISSSRKKCILKEMSRIDMESTYRSLEEKKLLKTSKNGTVKNTLDYNETKLLLDFNKLKKENIEQQKNDVLLRLEAERSELKTVPQIIASWPNPPSRYESLQDDIKRSCGALDYYNKLLSLFA